MPTMYHGNPQHVDYFADEPPSSETASSFVSRMDSLNGVADDFIIKTVDFERLRGLARNGVALDATLSQPGMADVDCETCGGCGYEVVSVAVCCNHPRASGECCANPVEGQEQEACSACGGTGKTASPASPMPVERNEVLEATKRGKEWLQGYRCAWKDAVTWLHDRGNGMNHEPCKAWCYSAAYQMGNACKYRIGQMGELKSASTPPASVKDDRPLAGVSSDDII